MNVAVLSDIHATPNDYFGRQERPEEMRNMSDSSPQAAIGRFKANISVQPVSRIGRLLPGAGVSTQFVCRSAQVALVHTLHYNEPCLR